jgi:hypothetical protein
MSSPRYMTVLVPPQLEEVLRNRAATNHRTLSKEMIFLMEAGLGVSSEKVREAIHLFYKMNAEVVTSEVPDQPM